MHPSNHTSTLIQHAARFSRRLRYALLLIAVAVSGWAPRVLAESSEFVIGVIPRHTPSETVEMFNPLAQHLGRELGKIVKIETTPDFKSFWEAVAAQRFHLVLYNQYHYVRSRQEFGYVVVAKNEEMQRSVMGGVIMVRKDSGIKTMADLRGKKIVFCGDRKALMSYVLPTYMLMQAGLKKGDYREEFSINPPNVALAIFFQRADAGGSGDVTLDMPFVREKIDVTQMQYIMTSEPVAHLPWAVRADVPVAEREQIQKILLGVKASAEAAAILGSARLTNIVAVTDAEYNLVRHIIHTVTGEQY